MNDNLPSRDKVIAEMLTTTTVISIHLGLELRNMLQANGVQPQILDAVETFIQPALERMQSTEAMVIAFAQEPSPSAIGQLLASDHRTIDTFNAVLMRLETFSDEFSRLSNTTDQMRVSSHFREFVGGMTAAFNPQIGKDMQGKCKETRKTERDHDVAR